jgi:arginine N-succinyltransferase
MLIGAFPDRFSTQVMAEMRGWQGADGRSPFWDAVGARFFDMSFEEADHLSAVEGSGFIADLMPKQPIYTALLPDDARMAIGRAHEVSARAMTMLMHEDFRYEAHVDVFDGGPQVHAMRDRIRTIQDTRLLNLRHGGGEQPVLVSTSDLGAFRVIEADGQADAAELGLPEEAVAALGVRVGDALRVAPGYRRAS